MYQYWCYRYKTNTHNHLATEFHHYSYLNSHAGGIWAKLLNIPYWQTLLIGATTLQRFLNQLLLCAVRHQNMIGWAHGFLSKHWIWFQHAVSHSGEHRRASPWDETLVTLRITLHNSKWEECHTFIHGSNRKQAVEREPALVIKNIQILYSEPPWLAKHFRSFLLLIALNLPPPS